METENNKIKSGDPAILYRSGVSRKLGIPEHDIIIGEKEGIIVPLGRPAKNSVRTYATVSINELANDAERLHKLMLAIGKFWRNKNARRKARKEASNESA